jgi:hypothetical protein
MQGFVGTSGTFYTRSEAKEVAIAAKQIPEDFKGTLYSEDLWEGKELPELNYDDYK